MSKDELAQLGAEVHQWKARAEKAEAELNHIHKVCAEMREALSIVKVMHKCQEIVKAYPLFKRFIAHTPLENDIQVMASEAVQEILKALSSEEGKGYYSEAEVRPLVEALEKLHGFSPRDIDEMSLHSYVNTVAGDALEHARSLGIGKETP